MKTNPEKYRGGRKREGGEGERGKGRKEGREGVRERERTANAM